MKAWRTQLPHLMPLVAVLFATGVAVPRPGLVFHVHAGGDHVHTHGEELAGEEHDADHEHEEHHHHHDGGTVADHDDAGFEAPDPVHLGHWHSQYPFQRTVVPTLTTLATAATVVTLQLDVQADLPATPLLPDRARGPPWPA